MMDLMMRWAHENTAQQTAERNPQMRMLQMHVSVDEDDEDDVRIRQRILMGRVAEEIIGNAIRRRGRERDNIRKDNNIDRMHAAACDRRQHFRRMMHAVEFPHEGNAMTEIMIEPVAEFV